MEKDDILEHIKIIENELKRLSVYQRSLIESLYFYRSVLKDVDDDCYGFREKMSDFKYKGFIYDEE